MRRAISRAILGVAILLVVGLGLPLAVVVDRFYVGEAESDLRRRAAEATIEITIPLDARSLAAVATEPDAPGEFSVYGPDGRRIHGGGPARADAPTRRALAGVTGTATVGRDLVVAVPITERNSEAVVGALRVVEDHRTIDGRVRRAWGVMAAAIVVALLGAGALARRQGGRLARPVVDLAEQADRLGRGTVPAAPEPTDIPEVDVVAASLAATGERVAAALSRERAFSADVSHQLRTPLTGLRLRLERAAAADETGAVEEALVEVDRLRDTIDHLLALSRDRQPGPVELDVARVLAESGARWSGRYELAGRSLAVTVADALPVAAGSEVSVAQILDVLLDNSLRHGDGPTTVLARVAPGGVVVEVADTGPGIPDDRLAAVFTRHDGADHGIGLGLARRLAEADGGRLLLVSGTPPTFHLVLALA